MFAQVERECTRFDPASDLMRANAADGWHPVGRYCFAALEEAAAAHRSTQGRFDPRVLRTLESLGYDRTLPFADTTVHTTRTERPAPIASPAPWQPAFDPMTGAVRVGPDPVELGGIGKGLAVRWAAAELARLVAHFVLDAGGDVYLGGCAPSGLWQVGVEDPHGATDPVAVLALGDTACATSSTRVRRWVSGGRPVHHLIDPRTGAPGGTGLSAVTVVDPDPAAAEVWSKVLFLAGSAGIAAAAGDRPVLWTTTGGVTQLTDPMREHVVWQRP